MNSNIERKLNEVLKAVGNISERIDKLNEKLENFDRLITKLEYLVENKISKFQQELKTKADDSALNELHLKIRKIEQQQVDQLAKDVMQESYEKLFNLLIIGIEETDTSVWEKRETTLKLVQDFMKRGLQIKYLSAIMLANYQRLLQHPVLKNDIKVNRPIIIKLTNSNDKRLKFGSLKNLKQFNNARKLNQETLCILQNICPSNFNLSAKLYYLLLKRPKL